MSALIPCTRYDECAEENRSRGAATPEQFAAEIKAETARLAKVLEAAGIRPKK